MGNNTSHYHRTIGILTSLFVVVILALLLANRLSATTLAADLSTSTKEVNKAEALAGSSLQYTIVVNNSGDTSADNVIVTDTLPAELTYQTGSLMTTVANATETSADVTNNVVSWTGSVGSSGSVTIVFDAVLTDTVAVSDVVENTFEVTGDGSSTTDTASTTIVAAVFSYLPIIAGPVPAPVLENVSRPNSSNQWTVSWNAIDGTGVTYEVQEDSSSAFSSPDLFDNGADLSRTFNNGASIDNYYCYRVRAVIGSQLSKWSNVECIVGAYYDDMSSSSSGWAIRQQDTDDADNESWYTSGNFVLKIHGRWDYAVASPLRQAPEPPYEISTRIRLEKPDNLNSYGLIFGGDWNGQTCPNSTYTSCFNHYYRLQIIWYGADSKLRIRLKRIDKHDQKGSNEGRGDGLTDYRDVKVGSPTEKYLEWRVQVLEDGQIKIFVNDNQVASALDTTYINSPYFGIFAATDEYLGAEPWVDWYKVTPLD